MKEKDQAYKKLIRRYETLVEDFMSLLKNPRKLDQASYEDYRNKASQYRHEKQKSPGREFDHEIPRHRNNRNGFGANVSEIERMDDGQESSIDGVREFVSRA